MKYLRQFSIILSISFLGEVLYHVIPLPIPAGIYGIILMFLGLELKLIPIAAVKETGTFLIEFMPVMFVPAAVGILESWHIIRPSWLQYLIVTVVSTVAVMLVSGRVTQAVLRHKPGKEANP